jgi:hypothetical protein
MAAASRSLATTLQGARFASGLLQPSYTTYRDTTRESPYDSIREENALVVEWEAHLLPSSAAFAHNRSRNRGYSGMTANRFQ